ncbi:MAG TPA: DUF29 domain-containing protein [Geminicoccaceae bacterium]
MATELKTRAGELYEQDFVRWTEDQAAALRAGRLDALDLEHLAEETDSSGGRDRRELDSRLEVLVMHLLKWRYQPRKRTGSWESTIRTQRREIAKLLGQSPSLRREVDAMIADAHATARRNAAAETALPLDTFPEACPFTAERVLEDEWLPG